MYHKVNNGVFAGFFLQMGQQTTDAGLLAARCERFSINSGGQWETSVGPGRPPRISRAYGLDTWCQLK